MSNAPLAVLDPKEAASRRLGMCASEGRLPVLLEELSRTTEVAEFWRLLQSWWPMCDDTWAFRQSLAFLHACRRRCPQRHMLEENLRFWRSLPEEFTIYRGCSAERAHGSAWTTDREVALGFARGHRGLRVPSPVLCRAAIRKDSRRIFFVSADREESEIVLIPDGTFLFQAEPLESAAA